MHTRSHEILLIVNKLLKKYKKYELNKSKLQFILKKSIFKIQNTLIGKIA